MEAKVDEAIKALAGKAENAKDGLGAMQYGQAALNLAQALSVRRDTHNREPVTVTTAGRTEKEILTCIAQRLDIEDETFSERFNLPDTLCINTYYHLRIEFDENGTAIKFDTHP
jgi:hypothetical protein